jgi:hypothetical protein
MPLAASWRENVTPGPLRPFGGAFLVRRRFLEAAVRVGALHIEDPHVRCADEAVIETSGPIRNY